MNCFWCHNPESLSFEKDILFHEDQCIDCKKCVDICPNGCHSYVKDEHKFDRMECTKCGECVEVCFSEALKIVGARRTIDSVMEEIIKDIEFYRISGGGVTLSGGEPLLQAKECYELLKRCKQRHISTAIDTAGNVNWSAFETVLPVTDYIIFDIKTLDNMLHQKGCGVPNKNILANLKNLKNSDVGLIVRIPIIPGFNDRPNQVRAVKEEVKDFQNIEKIELIPFHKIGMAKYQALDRIYKAENLSIPGSTSIEELQKIVN